MKRVVNILMVLIFPIVVFATGQEGDILIWDGDTLVILSNPLELRGDIDLLRPNIFGDQDAGLTTACCRGYIAEWTLIDKEIFLTNIFSCTYYDDSIKSDLKTVFGPECVNGRVKATWFTGKVIIPKGKLIHYINDGYNYFLETEQVLTFENGLLTAQKTYDNSRSYKSIFSIKPDSLPKFISKNIDWDKIPDLKEERVRVIVSIRSGETRKPDSIYIIRGSDNEILNQEALRVVNLIPEWDVYYRFGEARRMIWSIPVIFDEERRKKNK